MAEDLTNKVPAITFGDLTKVDNNNQGIDSTLRVMSDGKGTESPLYIASNAVRFKPASNGVVFDIVDAGGTTIFEVNTGTKKVKAMNGGKYEGDGSELTNVTSVGVGGATSIGNLQMIADSGDSGTGDLLFLIGSTIVGRIPNSYAQFLNGAEGQYFLTADGFASPSGGAILDGDTQYYSHPYNANFAPGLNDFTLEACCYNYDKTASTNYGLINCGTSNPYYYMIWYGNKIRIILNDGSSNSYITSDVPLGLTHIIASFDRDSNLNLYVNGSLFYTADISSLVAFDLNPTNALNIGALFGNPSLYGFANVIYFTKIHDYALVQSDVNDRWNNGLPTEFVEPYDSDVVFSITSKDWGTNGAKCKIGGEISIANASGNPICPNQEVDGSEGVAATSVQLVLSQPKNTILEKVLIINTGGVDGVWKVGTTTGASDIGTGTVTAVEKIYTLAVNEAKITARDVWVTGVAATAMTFIAIYKEI